jgi:hypothetical protein
VLVPSPAVAKKSRTPAPPRVQAPQRRDTRKHQRASRAPGRPTLGGVNRLWLAIGAVVVLAVVGGLSAFFATRSSNSSSSASPRQIDWAALPGLQTGPPPWDNGSAYLPDKIGLLGLDQLAQEALAYHIHAHVDVYVNGKKVIVPAGIGIYANSWLTEVHTHDTRGVIHIEAPSNKGYTLGQFFGEWGVKLTKDCLGRYCGAKSFHWWLDGKPQTGDPALVALKPHHEVAIAYGTPPTVVPKSYKFQAGE